MALLKKKLAFAFAISLMLVACGDDDSGSGVNKSVEKISDADIEEATYDDLPACKSTNKDKSAYVVDEALTYVCDGKKWVSEEKIDSKSSSKEKSSSSVEEKIFSSSSVEEKKMFQSSSSSEEEISSSSEEEIHVDDSPVTTYLIDHILYSVRNKHNIDISIHKKQSEYTDIDEYGCEIFSTYITSTQDTITAKITVWGKFSNMLYIEQDMYENYITLIHIKRICGYNGEYVTEFDTNVKLHSTYKV